jgi:hypothetical protein
VGTKGEGSTFAFQRPIGELKYYATVIGFKNVVRDLINDGRLVDWLIIDCWTSMPRPYGTTLDFWAI